jgi:hypothetical protein
MDSGHGAEIRIDSLYRDLEAHVRCPAIERSSTASGGKTLQLFNLKDILSRGQSSSKR